MKPLDNIKRLVEKLPGKDSELARKLIEERRFTDLIYLVESDLKNYSGEDKMWIGDMVELSTDISEYMELIGYNDD